MSEVLPFSELSAALARLGYTENPAGFHGALCGALCVGDSESIDLEQILSAGGLDTSRAPENPVEQARTLARVRQDAVAHLGAAEMDFTPLLPADSEFLTTRVQALAAWCEGFLYGLSMGKPLNMKQCSPELKEVLKDFTQFTQAGAGSPDDAAMEEEAYAELVEYIRVGAQLIFMELRGGRAAPAPSTKKTVH